MTIAENSLNLTGLFEAELLVELMLRYWRHPLADDADFRQCLLEAAAGVLKASVHGQQLLEELPAQHMNLVAAVWYAEASSLDAEPNPSGEHYEKRREWSDTIRRAIPSCFCNPELLQ